MALIEIMGEGGFIMYPLLLLSILAWAVALEKIWFLRQFSMESKRLVEKATNLIRERKIHEAKGLCHNVHPLVSRPFLVILESSESKEIVQGRMERRLKETQQGLKRYLWVLGTIGSSAPFIGLFGTVVGIIKSFESISSAGKAGFAVVAGGLGEALVATAAGILVAVMALIFYNYFQNRLSQVAVEFKHQMEDLKDLVPWP